MIINTTNELSFLANMFLELIEKRYNEFVKSACF